MNKGHLLVCTLCGVLSQPIFAAQQEALSSPNGKISLSASIGDSLTWQVSRNGTTILLPSALGLSFKDQKPFGSWTVKKVNRTTIDTTWSNRLFKKATIRDHANEMVLDLQETAAPGRKLQLFFRAYDSGVAFRYGIPAQPGFETFTLTEEKTQYRFDTDYTGWFTVYNHYKTSQEEPFLHRSIRSIPPKQLIGAPALVLLDGQMAAITEADLTDWAGMFLRSSSQKPADCTILETALSPRTDGKGLVVSSAPRRSPWRVMILGDNEIDLINNNDLILNLNPPPAGGDASFSWVQPGATGWDWWVDSNNTITKELTLQQIDFAAEMGWPYHTIDGGWYGRGAHTQLDTQKLDPLPELDFPALFARAKEKGVGIWLWVYWSVLEANDPDKTFAKFASWGVKGVKIDFMDRQDQAMVQWYEKIVRTAAKHKIMINFHGAFKPTGMNRTWPNQVTREGILGNEFNKFKPSITAEHTATLPFTRCLLGPCDFTPGSFANVYGRDFKPQSVRGHRYADLSAKSRAAHIYAEEIGTRAHALALCLVYDSPLVSLCDWPERYRNQPGIEALRNLPTTWETTIPTAGKIGKFYASARKCANGDWYWAAITVKARKLVTPLSFLDANSLYKATFYTDPQSANAKATELDISTRTLSAKEQITIPLAAEGGAVVIFRKVK